MDIGCFSFIQRAVSKFIPAEDIVVPYYTNDLTECERITHIIRMSETGKMGSKIP